MDPTASLEALEKRKTSCLCLQTVVAVVVVVVVVVLAAAAVIMTMMTRL
jgi:hypothetical protein